MTKPTCPHCRVTMEAGHLLGLELQPVWWVSGNTDWAGKLFLSPRSKLKDHDVFIANTYRCPDCGFLSSYASTSVPE